MGVVEETVCSPPPSSFIVLSAGGVGRLERTTNLVIKVNKRLRLKLTLEWVCG